MCDPFGRQALRAGGEVGWRGAGRRRELEEGVAEEVAVAARPVWAGNLSFGLVSLPVGLYTATDSHTIHFHQLQRETADRIRNRRVNERTGDEVELDDIVKEGYDAGGEYVLLAQAAETIPSPGTLRHVAYEQKFDGHRALPFTPPAPGEQVLLQTRRGALIQDRFPDLVAAAIEQLPNGLVLDGGLLVRDPAEGRLSFEALQRRAAARARGAAARAARTPAYFIVFDLLQADGIELLNLPYRERRRRLEVLFAARGLSAPWTLCPMTTDLAKAREWLETWTDVSGVEGILIKAQGQRYLPGTAAGPRFRRRDTTEAITEAIIGAITGNLARRQLLILGRHDTAGRPRSVGRNVARRPDQARQVAEHLEAADPGHPWTGVRFAAAWGSREALDVVLVRPDLVAEVSADTAVDHGGIHRRPLRFRRRLRMDMAAQAAPLFGTGPSRATG
ncbi:ATP-dependent DNA ligase [Streptomyces sp. NPDC054949]